MTPSAMIAPKPNITNAPPDVAELSSRQVPPSVAYDPAAAADAIDRSFHAALARFSGGLSPAAMALAFADWQLHLLASPGKQAALTGQALQNALQFIQGMRRSSRGR
jgi:polyhydroxyalkanoate synthase